MRDLHVDVPPRGTAVADRTKAKAKPAAPVAPAAPKPPDESADALPEDVVMPPREDEGAAEAAAGTAARAPRQAREATLVVHPAHPNRTDH